MSNHFGNAEILAAGPTGSCRATICHGEAHAAMKTGPVPEENRFLS